MTKERYAEVPMDDDAELKELFEHLCTEKGVDPATTRTELKATSKVTIPSLQKLGAKLKIKLVFDYRSGVIEGWYTVEVGDKSEAPAAEAPMALVPPERPAIEEPAAAPPVEPGAEKPAPPATEVPAAAFTPPDRDAGAIAAPEAPVAPTAPEVPTPPVVAPVVPPVQPTAEVPAAAPAEVPGADESLVQEPAAPPEPAAQPQAGDPAFKTVKDPAITGEDDTDDEPF